MPGWKNSNRRSELPADWDRIRKVVLERDGYTCTERYSTGERCGRKATDVDHVRRGNDHRLSNLRSLCGWHHDRKSASEGAAELYRIKKEIHSRFRRTEAHPYA